MNLHIYPAIKNLCRFSLMTFADQVVTVRSHFNPEVGIYVTWFPRASVFFSKNGDILLKSKACGKGYVKWIVNVQRLCK